MKKELKVYKYRVTCTFFVRENITAYNQKEALQNISHPSNFYDRWKHLDITISSFDEKFEIEEETIATPEYIEDYKENRR